jgi:homoserine dehydrogenase
MENYTSVLSLCLIGFGSAGQAFCDMLLSQRGHTRDMYGVEIRVTGIATQTKGVLLNPSGLDLKRCLADVRLTGTFSPDHPNRVLLKPQELIRQSKAQVLVELSTLSIEDGQPAISHIETAFDCGMHVITANKGPLAWDYRRLKSISEARQLEFLHETTVMDGAPIFNLVRETLPGCRILSFKGILNSTTNFVLERMEAGDDYDASVLEAQRQGFAEADPSLDIDGWDAAAKTSALINVLMAGETTPMTIDKTGIRAITQGEIQDARTRGGKIKLLCEGWLENGIARGRVKPTFIDGQDLFSTVDATTSILSLTTDLMGELSMVERRPEIQQTAYGIYSDTLTLIRRLKQNQRI